jgi:hypothetical protein
MKTRGHSGKRWLHVIMLADGVSNRSTESLPPEAVMSTVSEQTYTPEDLLAMPDRKRYELVDGHLAERHMSVLSNWVGGQLHFELTRFVRERPLG